MLWKPVQGYEKYYLISDNGVIKSLHTYNKREPIIRNGHLGTRGYMTVDFCVNRVRKNMKIHRLVARAFLPNPEAKPQVNHKDGNKLNNHYSNLEWVTQKENSEHASAYGLLKPYDHLNAPKLTPALAVAIFKEVGSHRQIGRKYGIGTSTVAHIKRGSRWGKYTMLK